MDIRKLQRTIVDALEDVKAQDIRIYDTIGLSDLFDRVVLASGSSNRQTRALASNVAEKVKAAGGQIISVEGTDSGEWVLVDTGDVVVHIMLPPVRAHFALEEIWGGKPVRLRPSAAKKAAARSAAADGDTAPRTLPGLAKPSRTRSTAAARTVRGSARSG